MYSPRPLGRPASLVQRMEDKYEKQNRMAASAFGTAADDKETAHGNKQIDLANLLSKKLGKKLAGFSSKEAPSLQYQTALVPVHINQVNAEIRAGANTRRQRVQAQGGGMIGLFWTAQDEEEFLEELEPKTYTYLAKQLIDRGLQLREPHVNDAGGLPPDGDMDVAMARSPDPVKRAWWYYAKNTPSSGWEKMTGKKRPHTPQFAEIGMGGFVPRAIYDWYRNTFYLTPHYNPVLSKGLPNAYVKMMDAENWTEEGVLGAYKTLTTD